MKKTKNVLLLSVLLISVFALVSKVNAATAWGITRPTLVCDPVALSPGDKSTCYLVGTQYADKDGSVTENAGFYLYLYTTQNLILKDVAPNTNLGSNAKAIFVEDHAENDKGIKQADDKMPDGLKNYFTCNVAKKQDEKNPRNRNSSGCGVFYTVKGQKGAYVKSKMGVYGYLKNHQDAYRSANIADSDVVVLGTILVQLDEKNNLDGCGELCIAIYGVAKEEDWGKGNCTNNSGMASWDGETCTDADTIQVTNPGTGNPAMTDGDYGCYELKLKPTTPKNTPTGAFVSYAILAAGALIAISAVTIAKKNNRLQKI